MLMKSPHVGPDGALEKIFSCVMVILGVFFTVQLMAVVTVMVSSFDRANSRFRDLQQEYIRFSSSRALSPVLRRKLLTYSLQEWSVNLGFDVLEMIRVNKLPRALSNSMLHAIYDDIVELSSILRIIEKPVLVDVLRYMKVVVSLQKETLINQHDPCTRLYILRQGNLQASASDRLIASVGGGGRNRSPNMRSSTWKLKKQVRMIERPGDMLCCRSPYEPPQPLPFQVVSLKRSVLIAVHMQDLHQILTLVSPNQKAAICDTMVHEHEQILKAVRPKTAPAKSTPGEVPRLSQYVDLEEPSEEPVFDEEDLDLDRLQNLERDVDKCIADMTKVSRRWRPCPPGLASCVPPRAPAP